MLIKKRVIQATWYPKSFSPNPENIQQRVFQTVILALSPIANIEMSIVVKIKNNADNAKIV